jgi:hypothetical protein
LKLSVDGVEIELESPYKAGDVLMPVAADGEECVLQFVEASPYTYSLIHMGTQVCSTIP